VPTKPPGFGAFDAVLTAVATFTQTVLIRVVTGVYPPLWACAVIGGLTGAACAVGAAAARRRVRR
jgi:hypothetical protein